MSSVVEFVCALDSTYTNHFVVFGLEAAQIL